MTTACPALEALFPEPRRAMEGVTSSTSISVEECRRTASSKTVGVCRSWIPTVRRRRRWESVWKCRSWEGGSTCERGWKAHAKLSCRLGLMQGKRSEVGP